jgi:hypothetical protein
LVSCEDLVGIISTLEMESLFSVIPNYKKFVFKFYIFTVVMVTNLIHPISYWKKKTFLLKLSWLIKNSYNTLYNI